MHPITVPPVCADPSGAHTGLLRKALYLPVIRLTEQWSADEFARGLSDDRRQRFEIGGQRLTRKYGRELTPQHWITTKAPLLRLGFEQLAKTHDQAP